MAVVWEGEVSTNDIRTAETCGGSWEIWKTSGIPAGACLPYFDVELALGIATCYADITVSSTEYLG